LSRQHRAELAAKYPEQFSGENIGLDWPYGWHTLVSDVCAYAAERQIPVRWLQIKEKLASLRMHYEGGPLRANIITQNGVTSIIRDLGDARAIPGLQDKIMEAEKASLHTCCRCGTTDEALHPTPRRIDGWWLVGCDACMPLIEAYCALRWDRG
jgi:hypothetical protein